MLFYSLVASVLLLSVLLALYWQWRRILPLLPDATRERVERWLAGSARFVYRPLSALDWRTALDEGISSSLFDIEANIRDGDSRAGLDEDGLQEVHRLMQEHHLSFDEARLRRHRALLSRHNIDARTGMPLDAKAVTHL